MLVGLGSAMACDDAVSRPEAGSTLKLAMLLGPDRIMAPVSGSSEIPRFAAKSNLPFGVIASAEQ